MNAVDTNILVYSITGDDPDHHPLARDLVARLTPADTLLLWQVVCEFGAVVSRLARQGRLDEEPGAVVRALRRQYPMVLPSASVLDAAIEIQRAHQVSYWDAMLLGACVEAGVTRLYTQDVQSAPVIRGVEIVNPFA